MLWSCLVLIAEHTFVPVQWERSSVPREALLDWLCLGIVGAIVGAGALVFAMGTIEISGVTHSVGWQRRHDQVRPDVGPLPPLAAEIAAHLPL
ncbi:hypothetical protein ABID82_005167 [Methylobacterium sp. PvP062]|uniref:Uncharacterized protein n=1 Tax=Methylobacterium radiotolerans TaxID=31998 RepID=A0ABV2NTR9_9HYPH|nr:MULTISPECIES: hypothetical protein [unclassified Methylobacterium]MBP2498276.1 hypothetical protein [Methylobacterium sp. PvP105]MBP2505660.1 hypothetical protein [Methylobacterium sp. PvP109]